MKCPKCGNELYVDFRSDGYTLWRCKVCPYMEVTEEDGEDAQIDQGGKMITKPQVFTAILCLTAVCILAMWWNFSEVAVGAGAGILAVGLKILESKN